MNTVCPVHADRAPGQVNWAGLPINLDLAFSRKQRDRVYVQHLLRKREAQRWRLSPGAAQACVCDVAGEHGTSDPEADQPYAESLSADIR